MFWISLLVPSALVKQSAYASVTVRPHLHYDRSLMCCVSWYQQNFFFLIKPTDALISQIYFVKKLYMFRIVPLPIIRSFPPYIWHWCISCRFDDSFQAWLVVLESCHHTCMTYTSDECTVENSWWWAEELSETCRVSWQNKFGKLVRLVLLNSNLLRCMVTWT